MKISNRIYDTSFEVFSRKVGPNREKCFYQKALYNTLIEIRPKFCLEIGTNTGNTAKIFQKYFDQYMHDGILVTCDIKKYVDLQLKNVKQVIVSHHIHDIEKYHNVEKSTLQYVHTNSVNINTGILSNYCQNYDFAFIDGDHTKESFLKDLEICNKLLKSPKVMLIDDTKEPIHDCSSVYKESIKTNSLYECYDFEDWNQFVGCSLIKEKS